jgi:hypothetical protein
MIDRVSHDWEEETTEAKARWFQSLSMKERMELLCMFTDVILSVNPEMMEQRPHAQPAPGRVCVLTISDLKRRHERRLADTE